ncbi:hypothetical protein A2348_03745 [Candidatus Uhrbacteria bacterium RIFOXYB12_FULL_58_10]|nr:MAG: hypothetical protein A2348_03745 [Candidatus Uhrbacteria bacterium RIFOXYB12_FULL_58_10]OGL99857.1 MAG: hypothetical protein A2501_05525 [Candidatus Uhrbacteria bacterium RIFOXYC12_FULL_57_11]
MTHMHEFRIPGWRTIIQSIVPFYQKNVWYLVAIPLLMGAIAILPLVAVLSFYAMTALAIAGAGLQAPGTLLNVFLALLGVASLVWMLFVSGALQIATVRASYDGNAVPLGTLIRGSFDAHLIARVLGGLFLYAVMVMVGLVLFIVPGIYLAVRGSYLPYVLVRDKLGVVDSIKQSWALTRGYWWVTALRYGWLALASVAGSAAFAIVFSSPAARGVGSLLDFAWQMFVVGPFAMVFARHMYDSVRAGKGQDPEAFHALTSAEKGQFAAIIVLFLVLTSVQSAFAPKRSQADGEVFQEFLQGFER